jgi:hypothetical protein
MTAKHRKGRGTRTSVGRQVKGSSPPLVLLAIAVLALTTCSPGSTPTATPALDFQVAQVKTSTPVPTMVPPTVPRPTATFVPLITPSPTPIPPGPTKVNVPRISVADARAQADAGRAILVDVRASGSYEQEHIAGAISMPADQIADRYAELPADKLTIFYCA